MTAHEAEVAREVATRISSECSPCVATCKEFPGVVDFGGTRDGYRFVEVLNVPEERYGGVQAQCNAIAMDLAWSQGIPIVVRLWTRGETQTYYGRVLRQMAEVWREATVRIAAAGLFPTANLPIYRAQARAWASADVSQQESALWALADHRIASTDSYTEPRFAEAA